ncbi:MAG: endonuclease [Gammaproteobacteria bacterium]|nr:MAG: endonuclease [Gammaproteobacteria bacterium]
MKLEEILNSYRESIKDGRFSRKEKKILKEYINRADCSEREIDLLRNGIFEIARAATEEFPPGQIIDWLEEANKSLKGEQEAVEINKALFAPDMDCTSEIISWINNARERIDICVFTITDNRISKAITKAVSKGIQVKIISDDDKCYDRGSDVFDLQKSGASVRIDNSPNHMHHKFAIIDGITLITGSFNWTVSASNLNHENILITNNKKLVVEYAGKFAQLWEEMV